MNREDYCSFEQSQRFKKLGFDWECNHYYQDNDKSFHQNFYENHSKHSRMQYKEDNTFIKVTLCSAPTLSQAAKWLREVKGIIICIEPGFYKNKRPLMGYDYHLFNKDDGWYSHIESETIYDTYEQTLSRGIDAALDILEKGENV